MAQQRMVQAEAERAIEAPADVVYRCIADMREHHPKFLPPAFSDFEVESGGVGAGTIVRYRLTAGGRSREYRAAVEEPEPGRVLTESDTTSSAVTTFTVDSAGPGSRVRIATRWAGASGVGGFFERLFAPKTLQRLYDDELARLDAYARQQAASAA